MAIPSTARTKMISGIPGNLSHAGPTRAQTAVVNSTDASNNVFGRAFTWRLNDIDQVEAGSETGTFAGIMINPKTYNVGEGESLANGKTAEFLIMGEVFASVGNNGDASTAVGSKVYYIPGTGELTTSPNNGETGEDAVDYVLIAGAVVSRHLPTAGIPHLCIVTLTGPQPK